MSFLEIDPESDFSYQNLPYGIFSTAGQAGTRVGVAIGQWILDLDACQRAGLFADYPLIDRASGVYDQSCLNRFMELGRAAWTQGRQAVQAILGAQSAVKGDEALRARVLVKQADAQMHLPLEVGDYTDFYASKEHATNVGSMFRDPKNALLPNWTHLPVGYHGRASSVVVSGTDLRRPHGQSKPEDPSKELAPFGPSSRLDFELEMGAVVGTGNALGDTIPMGEAKNHIFGLVLLNDWSARDIQAWEYVPLGPFLGKNFGTTISPWVVTLDALEPFRVAGPQQQPSPLPYLQHDEPSSYDIALQVDLVPAGRAADKPVTVTRSNMKYMYWSCKQQLVHHCVNGCNMRTGDLLGTGTISGPTPDSYGSMLELAWKGTKPIDVGNGETRKFLADGDKVILRGFCKNDKFRVGFGECSGTILPANK